MTAASHQSSADSIQVLGLVLVLAAPCHASWGSEQGVEHVSSLGGCSFDTAHDQKAPRITEKGTGRQASTLRGGWSGTGVADPTRVGMGWGPGLPMLAPGFPLTVDLELKTACVATHQYPTKKRIVKM